MSIREERYRAESRPRRWPGAQGDDSSASRLRSFCVMRISSATHGLFVCPDPHSSSVPSLAICEKPAIQRLPPLLTLCRQRSQHRLRPPHALRASEQPHVRREPQVHPRRPLLPTPDAPDRRTILHADERFHPRWGRVRRILAPARVELEDASLVCFVARLLRVRQNLQ